MYLTSVKQTGQQVTINGVAQTNERISEFLRNAASGARRPGSAAPNLVEISARAMVVAGSRDARRMFGFVMGVTLKRPPAPGSPRAPAFERQRAGVRRGRCGTGCGRFDGEEGKA